MTVSMLMNCATYGLNGIGEYRNARDAMLAICHYELGGISRYAAAPKKELSTQPLGSCYIFNSGPDGEGGMSHHNKPWWPKYGEDFAHYIVEQGLGEVATLPKRLNLRSHPDTTCQTWLWSPDEPALRKWYLKERQGPPAVPVPSTEQQQAVNQVCRRAF